MKLNETAKRLLESGQWTPENIAGKSFQLRSVNKPDLEGKYPHWFLYTVQEVKGDSLRAVTLNGSGGGIYNTQEFISRIIKEVPTPEIGKPSPALQGLLKALQAHDFDEEFVFSISTTDYAGIDEQLGGRAAKIMVGCANDSMWAGGIVEDQQGRFSCWGNDEELQLDDAQGLDAQGVVQKLQQWLTDVVSGGER